MTGVKSRGAQETIGSKAHPAEQIERLLTEEEVALRQGRSKKTLRNQRVNGDGIPFLKLGRSVRYRLSDVCGWENARRRKSTTDLGGER